MSQEDAAKDGGGDAADKAVADDFALEYSPAVRAAPATPTDAPDADGARELEQPPSRELFVESASGAGATVAAGGGAAAVASSQVTGAMPAPPAKGGLKAAWYYWIFFFSGFAGLIYESIWARYLKLMLGHAAYAQALTLAIFLFGLAAGAALVGRVSARVQRPLLWYAGIEVGLALLAVYFHEIFTAAEAWGAGFVLPQIESDAAAELFKWTLAAVLILPQSILLGATFPLMSAGVTRLWPQTRGRVVAMLYFSNSLGAVFGVLAAGFVLIPSFLGLPGTIMLAGFVNLFAAAAVWLLGHLYDDTGTPLAADAGKTPTFGRSPLGAEKRFAALIAAAAFGTGLASFVYEIVWIRMLSLLFGASTVTFEVMLAVFILGLALGGFAARRRADSPQGELLHYVGRVQIVMGVLALWSLFCFPWIYEILHSVLQEIPRTEEGYRNFVLLQLGLSTLMMLPASFCAGMTLPLLTRRLLDGGGESAIGRVYAANTLGAIAGVALAVHVLLPGLGMQGALLAGALIDMLIGAALIGMVARARFGMAIGVSAAALAVAAVAGGINLQIAAAGVFRNQIETEKLPEVVFYQDGKTASIAVVEYVAKSGAVHRAIKTNGKADAELVYRGEHEEYGTDETTMVMLGLLPMIYKPDAERVMNIGFGSGMTSRVLLLSRNLRQLDNVEIEPAILDGARQLGGRVAPVFEDPRSQVIVNDAKTVMARARGVYDVIVSEPSNPWVSGVAGLFTQEFYARAKQALKADGVFVQWLHLYEFNPQLVASVVWALTQEFDDFQVYTAGPGDIIFVASARGELPAQWNAIFASNEAREFLGRYQLRSTDDVELLRFGGRDALMPYFESFAAPVNSDYFPYLENNAARAFFLKRVYVLNQVALLPLPIIEVLAQKSDVADVSPGLHAGVMYIAGQAREVYNARLEEDGVVQTAIADLAARSCPIAIESVDGDKNAKSDKKQKGKKRPDKDAAKEADEAESSAAAGASGDGNDAANSDAYLRRVSDFVTRLMPFLDKDEMGELWDMLAQDECVAALLQNDNHAAGVYVRFWRALSVRDAQEMALTTNALLPYADMNAQSGHILLMGAMLAHFMLEDYGRVLKLAGNFPASAPAVAQHATHLLATNAAAKI